LKQILLSSPHRNYYYYYYYFCHIVQFVEIPQPGITLGIPVHHQLPELAQTPVHGVGDAIQPSHPLLSPSPQLGKNKRKETKNPQNLKMKLYSEVLVGRT